MVAMSLWGKIVMAELGFKLYQLALRTAVSVVETSVFCNCLNMYVTNDGHFIQAPFEQIENANVR